MCLQLYWSNGDTQKIGNCKGSLRLVSVAKDNLLVELIADQKVKYQQSIMDSINFARHEMAHFWVWVYYRVKWISPNRSVIQH